MAYLEAEEMTVNSSNNTINRAEATDITADIDTYTSTKRDYVAVEGVLAGKTITVADAKYAITLADVPASVNLSDLEGHTIKAFGYFAQAWLHHMCASTFESVTDLEKPR